MSSSTTLINIQNNTYHYMLNTVDDKKKNNRNVSIYSVKLRITRLLKQVLLHLCCSVKYMCLNGNLWIC